MLRAVAAAVMAPAAAAAPAAPPVLCKTPADIDTSTVQVLGGVPYLDVYGSSYKLDVYYQEQYKGRDQPVIIVVHGGGFTSGSRDQDNIVTWAQYFARMGYIVASIDYPLAADYWVNGALVPWATDVVGASDDCVAQIRAVHDQYCAGLTGQACSMCLGPRNTTNWDRVPARCHSRANLQAVCDDPGVKPPHWVLPVEEDIAVRAVRTAIRHFDAAPAPAAGLSADMSRVGCFGTSAGAITCHAALVLDTNITELNAHRPNVSVGLSGCIRRDITGAPPAAQGAAAWEMHGTADTRVTYDHAEEMFAQFRKWGVPFTNVTIPGAGHVPFDDLRTHIDDVFGWLCGRLYPTAPTA